MKLEQAIGMDRNNPIYRRNAGNAHLVLGEFSGAVKELERAISLGMNSAETFAMLGDAYRGLNNHSKARSAYQSALKLDPRNQKAVTGLLGTK